MNSDIRLAVGWNRHPKVVKLKRKLGADGVLGLIGLWTFAGENRTGGTLHGMDDEDIAIAADYPGDASKFVAILAELRLIERVGNDWAIHDWATNNPWANGFKARSEKAKKAIQARWDRRNGDPSGPENGPKNTTSMENHTTSIEKQPPSNTPLLSSPSPSPKDSKDGELSNESAPAAADLHVKSACPYQAIVDLYHETLPELRCCRSLTPKRKGYLKQRWNNMPGPDLDKWRMFFDYVRESDFLMGKVKGTGDRPPFEADLEWLINTENFTKIREGKYVNQERRYG